MKNLFIILLFFTIGSSCQKTLRQMSEPAGIPNSNKKSFTYLALGDSYTIGHDVPSADNYPNQTVSLLKNDSLYGQLKIIATTGWTTTDLKKGIVSDNTILPTYDIVTLLIGVNNQYQQKPIELYRSEFEELLKESIQFAGNKPQHVIVLSIPDWGVTPFAEGRDRKIISTEIDNYNKINKEFASKYNTNYINVTDWTREAANDLTLLAPDQLHPSGKEYARWAASLEMLIRNILKN